MGVSVSCYRHKVMELLKTDDQGRDMSFYQKDLPVFFFW